MKKQEMVIDIKWIVDFEVDRLGEIADGLEKLREIGEAEVINVKMQEKKNDK